MFAVQSSIFTVLAPGTLPLKCYEQEEKLIVFKKKRSVDRHERSATSEI